MRKNREKERAKKKKRSIGTKLSLAYAILTTTIIGGAAIFFFMFNRYNMQREGISNVRQLSETAMAQTDSLLMAMDQASIDAMTSNSFMDVWNRVMSGGDEEDVRDMKRILTKAYNTKSNIRRVSVYDRNGTYVSTGETSATASEVRERIAMIESRYNMNRYNSRAYVLPHLDFWHKESNTYVISEIKPVKNKDTETVGYIEIQQNSFYLKNVCDLKWNGRRIDVAVFIEDNNELFYMTFPETEESVRQIENIRSRVEEYSKIKEDSSAIYATTSSNYYTAKTVVILEKRALNESAFKLLGGVGAIAVVMMVITVFYSFWMTKVIMRPINLLVTRMEDTDLHNLNLKRNIKVKDKETQTLVYAFDRMADRLNETLKKQKQLEAVQTRTLFSALQSEMGPHFLYNSLGGIANLCESGENEQAADACYSLTEILRYASDYENSEVAIGEEIENLKAYMAIMLSRYRQRIQFEMYIDDEAKYILIPKLTLQPLVENAIRYSLMEHDHVIVKVYAVILGDSLIIEVKDNGCGIGEEARKEIQHRLFSFQNTDVSFSLNNQIKFGGMGLGGTLIRLSIYYGESFWYELSDDNDEGGTTILFGMDIGHYR